MPAERAPMRKVREVLRLRHALGVSERQIAVAIGVSRSTVSEYLRRLPSSASPGRCRKGWTTPSSSAGCSRRQRSRRSRHGRCRTGRLCTGS